MPGEVHWFRGNRRMLPAGIGLLILSGVLAWWLTQEELTPSDNLRLSAIAGVFACLFVGLFFALMP
ncbi:MAG: hypothetical protein AB1758_17600, partial [Candidatus Eremiobacterota bacterium]